MQTGAQYNVMHSLSFSSLQENPSLITEDSLTDAEAL